MVLVTVTERVLAMPDLGVATVPNKTLQHTAQIQAKQLQVYLVFH